MSMHTRQPRRGFSLIEALGAVTLLGLTLTAAVASFSYVMRSDLRIATKSEMDIDSRLLVERLRQDLWRTSREMILLHPEGDGPYEAISFPVVFSGPDGVLPLDTSETVDWTATVIYHMRTGTPSQILRTEFRPRDNDLSQTQRRSQLAAVVNDGHGRNTFNGANARTRELISNLVEWELDITPARFDTYAEETGRRRFRLGSVLLNDGTNQITFETAGKRPNTGNSRHLGIDTLTLTPSGLEREAEWMPVQASSGSVPGVQNMGTGETWSGNSQLWFSSTSDGNSFTLRFENDQWEERNFFSTGMKVEDVERVFVQPSDTPHTFTLKLEGNNIVWTAAEQTRTTPDQMDNPVYTYQGSGLSTRILVRGTDILGGGWTDFDGGFIRFNGTNVWARFNGVMRIQHAFIAESAGPDDPNTAMNYIDGTRTDFLFSGNLARSLLGSVQSDRANYLIEKDKHYLVGIRMTPFWDELVEAYPLTWTPPSVMAGTPPNAYIVQSDDATGFTDPNWSGRGDMVSTHSIHGLERLRAGHAPQGVYTSQIIDTRLPSPVFRSFGWNAVVPAGTAKSSVLEMKVRAASSRDTLAEASSPADWDSVPVAQQGVAPFMEGRFVQVQARFEPGIETNGETLTPELRDFTLRWNGGQRFADLSGVFTVGSNQGIYEVSVNGIPTVQGVTAKVSVFKDISLGGGNTRRITSSAFAEIVPRNRGREE